MALSGHVVAYRNAMAQAHKDYLEAGAGDPAFRLRAGATTVATIDAPLQAVASGSVTVDNTTTPEATAVAGGTIDLFDQLDGSGALAFSGVVTTTAAGTGDLQLDDVVVNAGDVIVYVPTALPTWSYPT